MTAVLWVIIFIVALMVMVGGAELFLKNAEHLGVRIGLSSFVIGIIIVGFGTSLPELTSSLIAVLADAPTIVISNAIGSNIANILLIGGALAFIGRKLTITRNLLDAELPFFVISTLLFAQTAYDGTITFVESLLLVGTFFIYFIYLFSDSIESNPMVESVRDEVQHERFRFFHPSNIQIITLLIAGLAGLLVGAHYVIESVLTLATALKVPASIISITGIALGTSLPELVVSLKALMHKKLDVAIGNIFGSNAFNLLLVVGLPGIFTTLPLDAPTLASGLPILIISSFIFFVVSLAQRLYRWEGAMFFLLYIFFIIQLFTYISA